MAIDLNRASYLASMAVDFVREQSKKLVSGFSKTVSSIAESLFRDSGQKSTFIPEYPAENQSTADNPPVDKVQDGNNSQGQTGVSAAEEGETWLDFFSRYYKSYGSSPDSTNGGETKPADNPTADKPTADKPTADKPTADKPTVGKQTVGKQTADKPTASEAEEGDTWYDYFSRYYKSYGSSPDSTNGGETKPADKSTADNPTADKPTADNPTADNPTADNPTADKPTVDKSTASEVEEGETWLDFFSRYYKSYGSSPDSKNGVETKPADKPTVGKPTVGKPPVGKPPVGKPPVGKPPVGKQTVGKQTVGTEPAANSSLPSLTLVGKQPATVFENWAYVQPQQRTNHCGVMAVNGFFQAQVIQPGDLVRAAMSREPDLKQRVEDNPTINLENLLSERGGIESESMLHVMNQLLATRTKEASDSWTAYPEKVAAYMVSDQHGNLEAFVDNLKASDKESVDRMVCFSQSGKINHWFALVKSGDTWLRLDNDQCGLPPNERGLEQGGLCEVDQNKRVSNTQLKEKLKEWKVLEVICDENGVKADYSTALQNPPS